ncbi:MAG: hypothetical protein KDC44_15330 [Phaeodactylibacter sp.]|nr:hypothetical protein [Phaeodactylibacter sp.]
MKVHKVAFLAYNERYLSANLKTGPFGARDLNTYGKVRAAAQKIGPWETFLVENDTGDSLKADNGLYLSIRNNGVFATGSGVSDAERLGYGPIVKSGLLQPNSFFGIQKVIGQKTALMNRYGTLLGIDPGNNSALVSGRNPNAVGDWETFTTIPTEVIDPRDQQVYKTIFFAGKIWMAENLRYQQEGSLAYPNTDTKKLGRLYTRAQAFAACPPGWHVPTEKEWSEFIKEYDKDYDGLLEVLTPGQERELEFGSPEPSSSTPMHAYKDLIDGGQSGLNIQLGGTADSEGNFRNLDQSGYYLSTKGRFAANEFWFIRFDKEKNNHKEIVSGILMQETNSFYSCRYVRNWY